MFWVVINRNRYLQHYKQLNMCYNMLEKKKIEFKKCTKKYYIIKWQVGTTLLYSRFRVGRNGWCGSVICQCIYVYKIRYSLETKPLLKLLSLFYHVFIY